MSYNCFFFQVQLFELIQKTDRYSNTRFEATKRLKMWYYFSEGKYMLTLLYFFTCGESYPEIFFQCTKKHMLPYARCSKLYILAELRHDSTTLPSTVSKAVTNKNIVASSRLLYLKGCEVFHLSVWTYWQAFKYQQVLWMLPSSQALD